LRAMQCTAYRLGPCREFPRGGDEDIEEREERNEVGLVLRSDSLSLSLSHTHTLSLVLSLLHFSLSIFGSLHVSIGVSLSHPGPQGRAHDAPHASGDAQAHHCAACRWRRYWFAHRRRPTPPPRQLHRVHRGGAQGRFGRAGALRRSILELGGDNAITVLDDADSLLSLSLSLALSFSFIPTPSCLQLLH